MAETHTITVIPGEGIGPEITTETLRVLRAVCGDALTFDVVPETEIEQFKHGSVMPLLARITGNGRAVLKGPIVTPPAGGFTSMNVRLRKYLDTYAGVRPSRTFDGIRTKFAGVDLTIIRESTEGAYGGAEFTFRGIDHDAYAPDGEQYLYLQNLPLKGTAATLSVVTPRGCERIVRYAFAYALKHGIGHVTCAHKATIAKATEGLLLRTFQRIAPEFPGVRADDILVDNLCQQLVLWPERYRVIVTSNQFGDILSDLAGGLIGSVGLAAGATIGERSAIFEATHGTAPDIAGQGKANPCALVLSAAMMLEDFGMIEQARRIAYGVRTTIGHGRCVTADLAALGTCYEQDPQRVRPATTREMADAIIAAAARL